MNMRNVAYPNLRAEMGRKNISVRDIARVLGQTNNTASNKLSGKTKISVGDALEIQQKLFPEFDLLYLFNSSPFGGTQ